MEIVFLSQNYDTADVNRVSGHSYPHTPKHPHPSKNISFERGEFRDSINIKIFLIGCKIVSCQVKQKRDNFFDRIKEMYCTLSIPKQPFNKSLKQNL